MEIRIKHNFNDCCHILSLLKLKTQDIREFCWHCVYDVTHYPSYYLSMMQTVLFTLFYFMLKSGQLVANHSQI